MQTLDLQLHQPLKALNVKISLIIVRPLVKVLALGSLNPGHETIADFTVDSAVSWRPSLKMPIVISILTRMSNYAFKYGKKMSANCSSFILT